MAVLVAAASGLYLLLVLAFGALSVMDWDGLACFDGDEPGCVDGQFQGDVGLGAVQASSWLLASVAVLAIVCALVMSLRLRRLSSAVAVLALAAMGVIIGQVLWARL
ncbi:MAG TPA: hypothetical protein VNS09_26495 [Solirubrobacter sp.]|nr:hypothetical protein [Solirubrobacter sp.]